MTIIAKQVNKHEMELSPYSCVELIANENLEIQHILRIKGSDQHLHTEHSVTHVPWEKVLNAIPEKIFQEYLRRVITSATFLGGIK